jgi:hypothetical protein
MFDEELDDPPDDFAKSSGDVNAYSLGRIGKHHVVVVSLPAGEYGLAPAATIAQALRSSLPHIRIGLLVGIGARVPGEFLNPDGTFTVQRDIRLGDVVVSKPSGTVVQMDLVKMSESDGKLVPRRIGSLDRPPMALWTALSKMKARHERKGSSIPSIIEKALRENVKCKHPIRILS